MKSTTLVLAAVAAMAAAPAQAQVGLTLNLFLNDVTNPNSGGTWELAVLGGDVVGLVAILTNIDDPTGIVTNPQGLGTLLENPFSAFGTRSGIVFDEGDGVFSIAFIQDVVAGLTPGVGFGGPADPLGNPAWDGSEVIITGGTFSPGMTPEFTSTGRNETEVNVLDGSFAIQGNFVSIGGQQTPVVRSNFIPEPSSVTLIGLAATVMATRRRRA